MSWFCCLSPTLQGQLPRPGCLLWSAELRNDRAEESLRHSWTVRWAFSCTRVLEVFLWSHSHSFSKAWRKKIAKLNCMHIIKKEQCRCKCYSLASTNMPVLSFSHKACLLSVWHSGDIGGQMGLFIGASVLTILEILDYIYEVQFIIVVTPYCTLFGRNSVYDLLLIMGGKWQLSWRWKKSL